MDSSIKRRKLIDQWRALNASGGTTHAQPSDKPAGTFQHFRSKEELARHLAQVEEAQKNGSPF